MANEQPRDQDTVQLQTNEHGGIFIHLQVPPDAEAGVDSLTFEYEGSEFDVLVPAGSLPGEVLQIQVGGIVGVSSDRDSDAANSNLVVEAIANNLDHYKIAHDVAETHEDPSAGGESRDDSDRVLSTSTFLDRTKKSRSRLLSELDGPVDDDYCNMIAKHPKSEGDLDHALKNHIFSPKEENVTVVSLGHGLIHGKDTSDPMSLHLFGFFDKASSNIASNKEDGDETNGMVWASGKVLAQALTSSIGLEFLSELFSRDNSTPPAERPDNERFLPKQQCINCLELGSGLGVCGLALAHALHMLSLRYNSEYEAANRVTILLTDHGESAVHLLRENIQRNLPPSFRGQSANTDDEQQCMNLISAESLIWGDAIHKSTAGDDLNVLDDEPQFHLILGSDILYNTHESYDPLVNTIRRYLHPIGGTILLSVRWRKPDLEREFFRMAEERCKGLKFQLWNEFINDEDFGWRRCPCVLTWEDYGNPKSELSNCYFHETRVFIKKRQAMLNRVSLANVTERDMELMTDDEYSKFEELQVQIYVGRYEVGEDATIAQP